MEGRRRARQPSLSTIKAHLHLSPFHHLLRFARRPLCLLIKFPLAVLASCTPACEIALRFAVMWEHLQGGPRCSAVKATLGV